MQWHLISIHCPMLKKATLPLCGEAEVTSMVITQMDMLPRITRVLPGTDIQELRENRFLSVVGKIKQGRQVGGCPRPP